MNTIFQDGAIDEFIDRINRIDSNQPPLWGKMTPCQMLIHCNLNEEMLQGRKKYKRLFFGRLFGPKVLKSILVDEAPLKYNQPTHPKLKIKTDGDFDRERKKWIVALRKYDEFMLTDLVHPFFGKMSVSDIGRFAFKHTDHHLRQFNV